MTTINLYKSQENESPEESRAAKIFDGSFVISLSVLLIVLVAIFAIRVYGKNITKENVNLKTQIEAAQSTNLTSVAVNNVLDFQTRLDLIKVQKSNEVGMNEVLNKVSAAMLTEARVTEYTYSGKENAIELMMWAKDYRTIAAQLMNFKVAENAEAAKGAKIFSKVEISEIKRLNSGVEFKIVLSLNK